MNANEKKRARERRKAASEYRALHNRSGNGVNKGSILKSDDGTTESGSFPANVFMRTTGKAIKDLIYVVKYFGLRCLAPQSLGNIATLEDVQALLKLRAATVGTPAHAQLLLIPIPECWTIYGNEETVYEALAFLESAYDNKGNCSLLRWEFVADKRIPYTATGAGGGEGYKPKPHKLPIGERQLEQHHRDTGNKYVGRKRGPQDGPSPFSETVIVDE